jgi:hypothetical protein
MLTMTLTGHGRRAEDRRDALPRVLRPHRRGRSRGLPVRHPRRSPHLCQEWKEEVRLSRPLSILTFSPINLDWELRLGMDGEDQDGWMK